MAPIELWGPAVWKLFHVLISQLKDESFSNVYRELFFNIHSICSYLPCPDCSNHAVLFLNKVSMHTISNKEDFKKMLCHFHNEVNRRTNKNRQFEYCNIIQYDSENVIQVFNAFVKVYNTNGNMKLLAESFQRKMIVNRLSAWIKHNVHHFHIKSTR